MPPDSEVVLEAKELASTVGSITLKDGLDQQRNGLIWKDNSRSPKEETIGSLSFTVIDSSSSKKQSNESSENFKTPARKPITRTKVPFEKGYSQMDWLKLTRTHPDLAGKAKYFFIGLLFLNYILMCYMKRQCVLQA